ncbi:N-acyl homoserine lactonase [Luteibacter yeojuensis]|uniref:N-acyl homoserine lactonase n=1 Tax=Luteibacter yeojuensis TaxID=345309 RepID=A0A7X5QTH5_9GAMM|nr:N-acyl homoserine lactonase [Luteibacter yeojuensis]NID15130.1 N-acyl homoserine lactonase [Luteibacter yeojuensis]
MDVVIYRLYRVVGVALFAVLTACATQTPVSHRTDAGSVASTAYAAHPASTATLGATGSAPQQVQPDGPTVARHLTERYTDVSANCGSAQRPSFLCSGVLFRATVPGPYHSWNPNPSNPKGTVSFSWLRKDAKFRTIYTPRYSNGFIFLPNVYADDYGFHETEVVCVYPIDAHTDSRSDLGCGPLPNNPSASATCSKLGITTGAAWVAHYRKGNVPEYMCSFYVSIGTANSAVTFSRMGEAMRSLPETFYAITPGRSYTNELLVRAWPQNIHATVPIEAFFYQMGAINGLANAQADQRDFFTTSRRWVPVIRMTMPQAASQDATFQYLPNEQAVARP